MRAQGETAGVMLVVGAALVALVAVGIVVNLLSGVLAPLVPESGPVATVVATVFGVGPVPFVLLAVAVGLYASYRLGLLGPGV